MGLESGPPTYISQLNSANPTTSDDVAEGDDHIRMIKAVLKNQFSGLSGTTAISSSEAELNILDGVTSTAAELNILDGVTSTAAELNILDGVTSTAAELNILDGVTSTAAELNILDGVTSTATELNYNDVTTLGTVETSKSVTADGSGVVNHADYQVVRPYFKDYAETVNAIGDTGGGSDAIDVSAGNVVTATVSSAEQTFTFTNPSATGRACSFTLILTNGGSQTVNWPASVDWAGGTEPTLTSSGVDILTFTTVDAGTIWYGFAAGTDMK
jgi:uncharacterized protein YkvS